MALQVWLPLNGDLNNQGLSNYSLSIARGSEIYDSSGKIGKCFYANGVNTIKIQNIIPDFYNYTGYTLSAWLYVEAQNTVHTGSAVISAGNWNQQVLNLSLGTRETNRYSSLYVSGTSWVHRYPYNFYINTWYHVVVSSDGIKTYAYVNGTLIGDTQAGFLPTNIQGNDIYIGGASYYSGMQFFGKINDVRIYDHCLSPKEVKEISKGLVLHYPLNNIPQQNLLPEISTTNYSINNYSNRTPGTINNGVYHVDGYQSSTSIDTSFGIQTKLYLTLQADTDYYLSFYCKGKCDTSIYFGNNVTKNSQTRLISNSNAFYRPLETKTLGMEFSEFVILKYHTGSETQYNVYIGFDIPNLYGIGSYMEFSNISLTTDDPSIREINNLLIVYDSSGYQHNGTIVGDIELNINTPRYNSSLTNKTQYPLKSTMYFPESKGLTISCWVNITTRGYQTSALWATSSNTNVPTDYSTTTCSHTDTRFRMRGTNDTTYTISCTGTDIPLNEWKHIVLTHDGSIIKLYINGVFIRSVDCPTSLVGFNAFFLGASNAGPRTTQGSWSDFRLYCTALSADDILELYNTSAFVDNQQNIDCFQFQENQINGSEITKQGQINCNIANESTEASINYEGIITANQLIEI